MPACDPLNIKWQLAVLLKILAIVHYYINVWAINQAKSLPGFRVVTSLDGINSQPIQALLMD